MEKAGVARRWADRVLLIGWDAADWKMIEPLVEQGRMPHLAKFLEEGVMGNVASLQPMLSPMLWTSIATGKRADKHNILGFAEPDPNSDGVRPVSSTSRTCRALWNIVSDAGMRAGVVNWFASHPAEPIHGIVVSDRYPQPVGPIGQPWPAVAGSVHPPDYLERAARLRVHPAMTTREQVSAFLPELDTWDSSQDKRVHELRSSLARCASVQMAVTWLMQEQPWDLCMAYFDTIDRFAHEFMEFHPPKMAHVSDEDFSRYRHVMEECYVFHDMMLGRLLDLAGPEATVIILSDHGFHCDELRPAGSSGIHERPVAWHRAHGVLAIHGPNIRRDQRVYGASLLDIAPTILMLLGLPVADDMDGKPLRQVLDTDVTQVQFDRVATYETGERAAASGVEEDPWAAEQALAHLEALGYLERGASKSREKITVDRLRNLGHVFNANNEPRRAMEQYMQVLSREPDDSGTKMSVAMCHLQLRDFDECERFAREVIDREVDAPRAAMLLGMIAYHRGDLLKAQELLTRAEKSDPRMPGIHRQLGVLYLRKRWWKDAERLFRLAIERDPHDAEAYDGLGVTLRALKHPAEAVEQHMRSISLLHYRPLTHIHLGLALAEAGQADWSIRAFQTALEMNPQSAFAHRCLAELYGRVKRDAEMAQHHRRTARALRAARSKSA